MEISNANTSGITSSSPIINKKPTAITESMIAAKRTGNGRVCLMMGIDDGLIFSFARIKPMAILFNV